MADSMRVIAVVRKKPGGSFEFVIRWFLNDFNTLPLPTDQFRVRVEWTFKAGEPSRFLRPDGTFDAPDVEAHLQVSPQNYFMLDPPRYKKQVDPRLPDAFWRVAEIPQFPVDCGILAPLDPIHVWQEDQGFGVCHLLTHSHRARAEWAAAKTLIPYVKSAIGESELPGSPRDSPLREILRKHFGGDVSKLSEAIAKHLSHRLVRYGPRPTLLPQHLSALTRELRTVSRHDLPKHFREDLLSFELADEQSDHQQSFVGRWIFLALATEIFKSESIREQLDNIITRTDEVRSAVGLRLVQGGTLIDYWCSPKNSVPACSPGTRGTQRPASEALGLGITIGSFSAADVAEWVAEPSLGMIVRVEQVDRTITTDPLDGDQGLLMNAVLDATLGPGCYPIERNELATLLAAPPNNFDSTIPPQAPISARICWDLVHSNAGAPRGGGKVTKQNSSDTIAYLTGDSKVEILIEAPNLKGPPRGNCIEQGRAPMRVGGFNVYVLWESHNNPDAQPYFEDPQKKLTLACLKRKWLITRRYSLNRDLSEALRDMPDSLLEALNNPSWMSIWQRQDKDEWMDGFLVEHSKATSLTGRDETTQDSHLPNLINAGFTTHSVDLRTGVPLVGSPGAALTPWDPKALINWNWTPEMDRDFQPVIGDHPQRYRFFVTTVDCFEQESEPVPVWTNDVDAGDPDPVKKGEKIFIFEPRRRAALLPPPDRTKNICPDVATLGIGRGLNFDGSKMRLRAWWETPYLAAVGGHTNKDQMLDDPTKSLQRAAKEELVSAVVLYRRRLHAKVDETPKLRMLTTTLDPDDPRTFPQWQQEEERLHREGWDQDPNKYDLTVAPPENGEIWTRDFEIRPWMEQGYEYTAIVSVRVKKEKRNFWIRDVFKQGPQVGRHVQLVTKENPTSPYGSDESWISETPADSDAVAIGVVPVPNDASPRGVFVDSISFHSAKPILSPPGLFRDAILLRLLGNNFVKPPSTIPLLEDYPTTDGKTIKITPGQREMVNAALARATTVPDTADCSAARTILASDFLKPLDIQAQEYGQHATIGFRGLHEVRFGYQPFSSDWPPNDEAEASKFRIYSVRVPLRDPKNDGDEPYVTLNIPTANRVGAEFSFPIKPEELNWQKLVPMLPFTAAAKGGVGRPAVVRVRAPNDPRQFDGTIISIRYDAEEARAFVKVKFFDMEPEGMVVQLSFFMAQPIYDSSRLEYWSLDTAGKEPYTIYLPVGGGQPERITWWIVSISAQDNEAKRNPDGKDCVTLLQTNQTTQPPTPQYFTVFAPTNNETQYLDPNNPSHRDWVPASLKPGDAKIAPRLVALWQSFSVDESSGLFLAISRQELQVGRSRVRVFSDRDSSAWKALLKIDAATARELLIPGEVLDPLADWLRGGIVDVPGSVQENEEKWHIAPEARMDSNGIIKISLPSIPGGPAAGFIDYYLHNRPSDDVTDGNWEYRYRAMTFVDLGVESGRTWRYLYSRPTAWTDYKLPETPKIDISITANCPIDNPGAVNPQVEFKITAGKRLFGLYEDGDLVWTYRVIVRRQSEYSLRSTAAAEAVKGWVLIGQPITLNQGQTKAVILDRMLERLESNQELSLDYEILVSQYILKDGSEHLIRAPSEAKRPSRPITIPGVTNGLEKKVVCDIVLK